jgi:hypothetical protein
MCLPEFDLWTFIKAPVKAELDGWVARDLPDNEGSHSNCSSKRSLIIPHPATSACGKAGTSSFQVVVVVVRF